MVDKSILEVFGEKSKDGDKLIAHTLQAIANMPRGESEDLLYRIMTKGDPELDEPSEERYIYRNIQGLPTKERRDWSANMLRTDIEQDPTFADTLSHGAGMERLAPQEGFLQELIKWFQNPENKSPLFDFLRSEETKMRK